MEKFRVFLDTAEIDQIKHAVSTGLVDGIATNPNKIAISGKTYSKVLIEIRAVFDGPIAFQAMGNTTEEIIKHGLEIHKMDPLLAVKVVANKIGLPALKPLISEGVRTNATLMFNPTQALLAGLAGSPFISPFIGRARTTGANGIEEIAIMRKLLDAWKCDNTCIIGSSMKDVFQVIEVILAGAHAIAIPFDVFEAMMEHPLTDLGMENFKDEYSKVQART